MANDSAAAPRKGATTKASGREVVAARPTVTTASTMAKTASRRGFGVPDRPAMSSAPARDPTPKIDISAPNMAAPPSRSRVAYRGSNTCQLKAKVNTTSMASIGSRRAGVCHTYRIPSRICPLARVTRSRGSSSAGRMATSAARTAM